MKDERYFLSTIIALLLLIFSQTGSAAYMKYTYQTPVMKSFGERSFEHDGTSAAAELFWNVEEQFAISFVIPEIEYEPGEVEGFYKVFENPVVSVVASNFFENIIINSSSFIFEVSSYEGYTYHHWWLLIDITDNNFPGDMERRASITIDPGRSYMTFYQDNYFYRRCAGQYPPEWQMGCHEAVYNSVVEFLGDDESEYLDEYPGGIIRLFGERIAVPEPSSSMLLLMSLLGMFFTRWIKFVGHTRVRCPKT